jgi:hypothetical protein
MFVLASGWITYLAAKPAIKQIEATTLARPPTT